MDAILQRFEQCKDVEEYKNPIGWWKVDTEADIEGRGTEHLGIYFGNIATILGSLKKRKCYNFFITKMKVNSFYHPEYPVCPLTGDRVYISGLYTIKPGSYEEFFKSLFPVESGFYVDYHVERSSGSAAIYYGKEAEKKEIEELKKKRAKVLKKLTKEDIEILGIEVE